MRDWNLVAVVAIRRIRDQGEESFFWWCWWWWWIVGSFLFFLVALGFVALIHSLPILIRCLIAETVSHAQFLGLSPDFHKSLGSKGDQLFFTSVDAAFTYRFSSGKNLQCHCKLSILLPILIDTGVYVFVQS